MILLQGREGKGNVHQCHNDGQEEDHLYLPADGGAHFCVTEPHLPHDPEALAVLIPLGDLLIVDDQHGGDEEEGYEEQSHKEQTAIHTVKVGAGLALEAGSEIALGAVQVVIQILLEQPGIDRLNVVVNQST